MKIRGKLSIFGLDVNNKSIENVPNATTNSQPTTKSQVDSDIETATGSVIPKYATDPEVLVDGALWYNTTQHVYKYTDGINTITLQNTGNAPENIVWINNNFDFPEAVGGVITLVDNITYFVTKAVDLGGDRIVCGINNVIHGTAGGSNSITSTGLGADFAIITSTKDLTIQDITIKDITKVFDINCVDGAGGSNAIMIWRGVSFVNCPNIGVIKNFSDFIFSNGTFINSGGLIFDGFCNTISFFTALFLSSNTTILKTLATTTINRRFRVTDSAFAPTETAIGIDFNVDTVIGSESYILNDIHFSGNGIYLQGIDHTSDKSLFVNCRPIDNTSVIGTMYMVGNVVATVIPDTISFVKIAGATIAGSFLFKYAHSSNNLMCKTAIKRKLAVYCTISFTAGNNKTLEFGIYDSKISGIIPSSKLKVTTDGVGKATPISIMGVIDHTLDDFIEIHIRNATDATNATVDLNVIVKEL